MLENPVACNHYERVGKHRADAFLCIVEPHDRSAHLPVTRERVPREPFTRARIQQRCEVLIGLALPVRKDIGIDAGCKGRVRVRLGRHIQTVSTCACNHP